MRLVAIDDWHPHMLEALEVEAASRKGARTLDHDLLRIVAQEVRMLHRYDVVCRGGEDPGAIELVLPGDPAPKKKSGWREAASSAMRGLR